MASSTVIGVIAVLAILAIGYMMMQKKTAATPAAGSGAAASGSGAAASGSGAAASGSGAAASGSGAAASGSGAASYALSETGVWFSTPYACPAGTTVWNDGSGGFCLVHLADAPAVCNSDSKCLGYIATAAQLHGAQPQAYLTSVPPTPASDKGNNGNNGFYYSKAG